MEIVALAGKVPVILQAPTCVIGYHQELVQLYDALKVLTDVREK